MAQRIDPRRVGLLICDIQERFRSAIDGFDAVVNTTNKMVNAARILGMPIHITEQNPKALGSTVNEITSTISFDNNDNNDKAIFHGAFPKSKFSMINDDGPFADFVKTYDINHIVICGIESHVCVLQTALEAKEKQLRVTVLADGISSCNRQEIPIAMEHMRAGGIAIVTSESFLFQLLGDAAHDKFKQISQLLKQTKDSTKDSLTALL